VNYERSDGRIGAGETETSSREIQGLSHIGIRHA